jgi:hypothetical protein
MANEAQKHRDRPRRATATTIAKAKIATVELQVKLAQRQVGLTNAAQPIPTQATKTMRLMSGNWWQPDAQELRRR